MDLLIKNLLITGLPGVGKTTLIKKLSEALKDFHPVGFYTTEIRERNERKGFELISLEGKKSLLSHKKKYGVKAKLYTLLKWLIVLCWGYGTAVAY